LFAVTEFGIWAVSGCVSGSVCLLCTVKNQKQLNPIVDQVLKQEMQPLFGTNTAATLNSEFLTRNSALLPHVVAGSNLCLHHASV